MRKLLLLTLLGVAVWIVWKRFVEDGETDGLDAFEAFEDEPLGDGDLPAGWVAHEPASTS